MRVHSLAPVLLLAAIAASARSIGVDRPMPVTLDLLRDRYRPFLVFAPSTTRKFIQQMRILAQGGVPMHERNLITVPILLHEDNKPCGGVFNGNDDVGQMSAVERSAARRQFHVTPTDFTVILIGKDGYEKLRSSQPITLDKLRSAIDAMPMRQDEMRQERDRTQ